MRGLAGRQRADMMSTASSVGQQHDASFDDRGLGRLRDRWKGKLIVKGVSRAEDAERAARLGADAVWLSNHGGRQLDGAVAGVDALPAVAAALGGKLPLLIDGGMRRGADAIKARALGAQAVAIGRALVANPRVLMLDELSLGLAPVVVQRIYGMLPQLLQTGLTVLLVEQDVSQALRVASRIHCLLEGQTTLEGKPDGVTAAQVEAAYFGLAGTVSADQPDEGRAP